MPFIFPTLLVAIGLGVAVIIVLPIILEAWEERKESRNDQEEMKERSTNTIWMKNEGKDVGHYTSAREDESDSIGKRGGDLRRRFTDDTITESTINTRNDFQTHFTPEKEESNPFNELTSARPNFLNSPPSSSQYQSPSLTPTIRSRASSCSTEDLFSSDDSATTESWNFVRRENISQEWVMDGDREEGRSGREF